MKVSLNWIKEFTDVSMSAEEVVEKIGAQLGAVEEVIDLTPKYQGIVIAKIVNCEKHPNADKLHICMIDDGGAVKGANRNEDGLIQVVCGAPNVCAGLLVAWLPPGATVPSTFDKEPLVLEAREIRGAVSNGMLASPQELALSDDHSGIVELSYGEIGGDFAKEFGLDDHIIDIENKMFTHRPDCFGILGVAREIAGITGQQFKSPDWYLETANSKQQTANSLGLEVHNKIPELVPRFIAQVIEGVEVKSSPVWMQAYLSRVDIRPVNNIVDVTNYAMYLTAQPLHAYDYAKLCKVAGTKTAQLETRLSKKGDTLKLLNGKTITFDDAETILITSNDIPVGIGGIMGGADTEVDENTTNIVLECANFDMYAIRRASMRHGIFTDAVTRFNKGQSYLQNAAVLHKSADWITQLAGGNAGKTIDVHQSLERPIAVHAPEQFVNERLGLDLDKKDMAKLLTNVEFDVRINGPTLAVTPPFWRTDIEIPEDIVEEIGRLYGYDHLPLELPKRDLTPPAKDRQLELQNFIRTTLAEAGANEVLSYSFIHGELLQKAGQDSKLAFELSNALSPDLQYYRLSLTPSLLEKIYPNIKAGYDEFALFEIGKAHAKAEFDEEGLPREFNRVAFVYAAADKLKHKTAAYYTAKLYASLLVQHQLLLFDAKLLKDYKMLEQMAAPYDPKRSCLVWNGKMPVGIVGEFRADVRRRLKLPAHSAGFELFLSTIQADPPRYQPLPRFPKVEQDLCLRVGTDLPFAELNELVQKSLQEHAHNAKIDVRPLDIYQKKGDDTHKQTTFRISIASYERTLTDQEVNKILDDVAAAAHTRFRAERI